MFKNQKQKNLSYCILNYVDIDKNNRILNKNSLLNQKLVNMYYIYIKII